ncbi:MAG: hypothetical protein Q4B61_12775 [Bacteroidales bacterium]|nr:hypothetical protein [Bacteroidales bacterium]
MKKLLVLLALCSFVVCHVSAGKKSKMKTKYRNALIFAYSQANSVYEDDNIKLELYGDRLWATNKTSKTIFIAWDHSFIYRNGSAKPIYQKDTKDDKSKKGVTDETDLFYSLPPKISEKQKPIELLVVTSSLWGGYSTSETPFGSFTEYDRRLFSAIETLTTEAKRKEDKKDDEFTGSSTIHFTEDESVLNIAVSLGYAFDKKAEEWNNIQLTTWISDVIFTPYYNEIPKEISKKEKKGFGAKESPYAVMHFRANSPFEEIDQEKRRCLIYDWEGDFEKGTFELTSSWPVKHKKIGFWKAFAALTTGFGLFLLAGDYGKHYYKYIVSFDGSEADWGKMSRGKDVSSINKVAGDEDFSVDDEEE